MWLKISSYSSLLMYRVYAHAGISSSSLDTHPRYMDEILETLVENLVVVARDVTVLIYMHATKITLCGDIDRQCVSLWNWRNTCKHRWDKGQEHPRAPGRVSSFNHSSHGKETILNSLFIWTNSLLTNSHQVSIVRFVYLMERKVLSQWNTLFSWTMCFHVSY